LKKKTGKEGGFSKTTGSMSSGGYREEIGLIEGRKAHREPGKKKNTDRSDCKKTKK